MLNLCVKQVLKLFLLDSGSKTLVDAVSECMRYYVSNCDNTHLAVGSAIGANVFMKICAWSHLKSLEN